MVLASGTSLRRLAALFAIACGLGPAVADAQQTGAQQTQLTPEQFAEMKESGAPIEADFFGLTAPIVEGEPFAFEIRAFTEGPIAPSGEVSFQVPAGTLLAAKPACETWQYDNAARTFKIQVAWVPGQVHHCSIQLLAPENRGNLYFTLEKRSYLPEAYDRVEREVPMDSATAGKILFRIGGVGIRALEIAVFLPLVLVLGAIYLGRRARRKQPGMPMVSRYELFAAALIAIGFLGYFVGMAIADWRSLSFPEARCEILDVERVVQVSRSTGSGSSRPSETYSFDARLAVAYELEGQKRVVVGVRPGSYLDLSEKQAARFLEDFQRGDTVPCWVDPQNPKKALIERGFGGAYGFALIPLGLLAAVGLFWRRR